MMPHKRYFPLALLAALSVLAMQAIAQTPGHYSMVLKEDWQMQSATKVSADGAVISQKTYTPAGWYKVDVPTTIIAGLLANKVYDFDPFYGMNFEKLKDPSLDKPWWFRKEFTLPVTPKGRDVVLSLHGINYKANVWLNGVLVADSNRIMNPYRIIELNVTRYIKAEGPNVLALEIRRPINPQRRGGDLAIDYADWIHYPPDYNGGIVNDIVIKTFDRVGIEYPLVTTHFDLPSLEVAHLTVDAMVRNYSASPQDVVVEGRIDTAAGGSPGYILFQKKLHLEANELAGVTFTPADFPQLNVKHPRIWWPWQYGKPELNRIELVVEHEGTISNTLSEQFGIREITSQFLDTSSRVFVVNGKRILIRGAAWSPDIFQRRSPRRQEEEIRLYRDMGMNLVRSEGKMEDDNFYALCDKYGMLVMTGWMCCGAWQYPELWDAAKRASAMASDSSVMLWLRNKPSVMVWLNGSDMPPRETSVERDYLAIESALKWPNPTISTADASKSKVSGYSGVKMDGPYEWVPPIYWETDSTRRHGGAWSYATEISPGPSIPPYESLLKFIPKDSLWFTTATWKYHCGTMNFGTTNTFDTALQARYGNATDIRDYVDKAQAQNYEAHRAMMEAYGLDKYHDATGVVQWMGSNPWPGLIWHTYDYYLYPAGTYFGMKEALKPLHIMYSYARNAVAVTNSLLHRFEGLTANARIYDLDGSVKWSKEVQVLVEPDSIWLAMPLPAITGLSPTYFLRLQLNDARGAVKDINWYWLSTKGDELNWKKSTWFVTRETTYADYSALQSLGKTTLKMTVSAAAKADSTVHEIKITNTGTVVAFQVHLRALKGRDGDDILPVLFSDNYLELAPSETRTIRCIYANRDADGANPYFLVSAWNGDAANAMASAKLTPAQWQAVEGYYQSTTNTNLYAQSIAHDSVLLVKLMWFKDRGADTLRPLSDVLFVPNKQSGEGSAQLIVQKEPGGAVTSIKYSGYTWNRVNDYKTVQEMPHTSAQLARFAGVYHSQKDSNNMIQIVVDGNDLVLKETQDFHLVPQSELSFYRPDNLWFSVDFSQDSTGNITRALVVKRDVWIRNPKPAITAAELHSYEGRYRSKNDSDNTIQLIARGKQLEIKQLWDDKVIILTPLSDLYFYNKAQSYSVQLVRDADGKVRQAWLFNTTEFDRTFEN